MRNRWLVPVGAIAATLVIAACGSSSSTGNSGTGSGAGSSPAAAAGSSGGALSTTKIGGATLLTNANGMTLYWFVPDSTTASKCYGSCAKYWPPVLGPVSAGSGVTGTLGVITRSNGAKQATWNGHPLYTYIGDTSPGQNKGNGLNISGGVWHDIVLSGKAAPASGSSPASSGGGAYGY
jgi:predicted lipoprotein with Yx(FWY)xxD motif